MQPYEWGEQPKKTAKLIKLNTNENPYPPPSSLSRKLGGFAISTLRLYPNPLCQDLRKSAAKYFNLKPDMIAFGNGSDELIALIFKTFFNRHDNALLTEYTYSHYKTYADAYGINHTTMPMKNFQIDISILNRIRCKVFFLTNPNAPTGIVIDPKEIETYINRHTDKLFVIDEAYGDFADAKKSCLPLVKKYNNLIVLRTFSKAFSLSGIRLGFALGNKELISALNKVRDPYNISTLTQMIGVEVFKKIPYYKKNIDKVKQTRKKFSEQLNELKFLVFPSAANFVFCRPPDGVEAEDLFNSLKKKHIYVRHFSDSKLADYLRISIGTNQDMTRVIKEIKLLLGRFLKTSTRKMPSKQPKKSKIKKVK